MASEPAPREELSLRTEKFNGAFGTFQEPDKKLEEKKGEKSAPVEEKTRLVLRPHYDLFDFLNSPF